MAFEGGEHEYQKPSVSKKKVVEGVGVFPKNNTREFDAFNKYIQKDNLLAKENLRNERDILKFTSKNGIVNLKNEVKKEIIPPNIAKLRRIEHYLQRLYVIDQTYVTLHPKQLIADRKQLYTEILRDTEISAHIPSEVSQKYMQEYVHSQGLLGEAGDYIFDVDEEVIKELLIQKEKTLDQVGVISGNKNERQNEYLKNINSKITLLTSSRDALIQGGKISKKDLRTYEFKNIQLKIFEKIHDDFRESAYMNKTFDISTSKDIIQLIEDLDARLNTGKKIDQQEILSFIPRLLNAGRGIGDLGGTYVCELIKWLNHSYIYEPYFNKPQNLRPHPGEQQSIELMQLLRDIPLSAVSGGIDAGADVLMSINTMVLKPEDVGSTLFNDLPLAVNSILKDIRDVGLWELVKKNAQQYKEFMSHNINEGVPTSIYVASYTAFLFLISSKIPLPPNVISGLIGGLGQGVGKGIHMRNISKLAPKLKVLEGIETKQSQIHELVTTTPLQKSGKVFENLTASQKKLPSATHFLSRLENEVKGNIKTMEKMIQESFGDKFITKKPYKKLLSTHDNLQIKLNNTYAKLNKYKKKINKLPNSPEKAFYEQQLIGAENRLYKIKQEMLYNFSQRATFDYKYAKQQYNNMKRQTIEKKQNIIRTASRVSTQVIENVEAGQDMIENTQATMEKLGNILEQARVFSYISQLDLDNYVTGIYDDRELDSLTKKGKIPKMTDEFNAIIKNHTVNQREIEYQIFLQVTTHVPTDTILQKNINIDILKKTLLDGKKTQENLFEYALAQSIKEASGEYLKRLNNKTLFK